MDIRIEEVIKNLKSNNFGAYYVETKEEVLTLIKGFVNEGDMIGRGGSLTLKQTGVLDYIESDKFDYRDFYSAKTDEEVKEALYYRLFCDTFFCSSNAVILDGRLYNVDGRCTRVAPLVCGPKQVIVIVGVNKIVDTLEEAEYRVKNIAAPLNAKRLKTSSPCTLDGTCHDCKSKDRICCSTVITSFNRIPERIKVIIVNESLGM